MRQYTGLIKRAKWSAGGELIPHSVVQDKPAKLVVMGLTGSKPFTRCMQDYKGPEDLADLTFEQMEAKKVATLGIIAQRRSIRFGLITEPNHLETLLQDRTVGTTNSIFNKIDTSDYDPNGKPFTIGRDPSSDLVVPDCYRNVSRKHWTIISFPNFLTTNVLSGLFTSIEGGLKNYRYPLPRRLRMSTTTYERFFSECGIDITKAGYASQRYEFVAEEFNGDKFIGLSKIRPNTNGSCYIS